MKTEILNKETETTFNLNKSINPKPTIIPLPKQFIGVGEVKGFIFTQIASTERAYMYEVREGGSEVWFEVIIRKTARLLIDFEKRIYSDTKVREIYPKANKFGLYGWTYRKIEDARKKLELLL